MCKGDHTLCHCEGFIKLNPIERCEYIKQHNLCYNCLAPGHSAYRCRLKMSCRKCNKRHHTLTHQSTPMTSSNQPGNTKEQDKDIETQQDAAKTNVTLSSHVTATSSTAILATALVPVREHESGRVTVLRALIDHGSQATFMSERAAQMLRLKRTPVNGTITGVGSTKTNVKHTAEIQLLSRHDASFNFTVKTIRESFHLHLSEIEIDRWLHTSESNMNNITIHGFCDASNRAYAAVAYLRVRTDSGEVKTSILAAKTKVAPTKPQSLPRLELSGAVLLAGLLKQIKEAMNIPCSQIYAWTDSTIVLAWLFGDPTRWNVYVRNRVVAILDNIGNRNWYHVKSPENPADTASRGQSLLDLKDDELWWTGPEWLKEGEIQYSRPKAMVNDLERNQTIQVNLKLKNENSITTRFENCDTLQELLKAIVYCKRFLKGRKMENKDLPVNTEELDDAMKTCLRMTQKDSFEEEIENLKTKRPIKKQSKLNNLKPYLDDDGILRQKLMTDFWHRWQQEYLSRMQQRSKWHHKVKEFEIGHIVLIKADNLPPAKWMMGRIVDKHPGTDGVTRVYSVKSGDSVVQRPFNKLCYLPIDTE
ncbi:hypothetical protein HF086_005181 [Spodoptera exigua]|uniref:DUF5641 domain-containing protein n=2 Tax=Spodoptera exigua TaxID=7107 RepID=A0A922MKM9_SPOEX|nr:hypothetical protein HF086_005181 [Spodoptera exigua]